MLTVDCIKQIITRLSAVSLLSVCPSTKLMPISRAQNGCQNLKHVFTIKQVLRLTTLQTTPSSTRPSPHRPPAFPRYPPQLDEVDAGDTLTRPYGRHRAPTAQEENQLNQCMVNSWFVKTPYEANLLCSIVESFKQLQFCQFVLLILTTRQSGVMGDGILDVVSSAALGCFPIGPFVAQQRLSSRLASYADSGQ